MAGTALFSSKYAGSVGCYAAMLYFGRAAFDASERYSKKNKFVNRMEIVSPNGVQKISVPLAKGASLSVGELAISEHANWRHTHWGAIYSAYGRTPFFEYFADDLKSIIFDTSLNNIYALNSRIHTAVVDFLDLPIETVNIEGDEPYVDLRHFVADRDSLSRYYQIWSDKFGFIADMSILDLLFNTGREAVFTLRNSFKEYGFTTK